MNEQPDSGGTPKKGDWVVILDSGGTGEEEGIAKLVSFVKETRSRWYWMFQFKDETRLFKRAIIKPDLEPEPKKLLSIKRVAGDHNEVKYQYKRDRYRMYKENQRKKNKKKF